MFSLRSAATSTARTFSQRSPRFISPSPLFARTLVSEYTDAPLAVQRRSSRAELTTALLCTTAKRFSQDHEWVSFDDETNVGTIGITDFAQRQLGDVVFIELPGLKTEVAQGGEPVSLFRQSRKAAGRSADSRVVNPGADTMGAVESVKAVSDIFAPVAGEITEINDALESSPELLNEDAETEGALLA